MSSSDETIPYSMETEEDRVPEPLRPETPRPAAAAPEERPLPPK